MFGLQRALWLCQSLTNKTLAVFVGVAQREGPHILPDNTLIAACFPYTIFHSEI